MRSISSVARLFAYLAFVSVAPIPAADPPARASATGSWTVAGERTVLAHARAFREPEPFGKGTSPCVLVSNEPVPDAAVPDDDEGIAELLDRMREGGLRALQVCFDAAGEQLRAVNDVFTFHPGVSPGRFGLQGFHSFASRREAGRIAGRLTGRGTTMDDRPWSVEVELSAPAPAAP
jgi:hypothetical protein